MICITIIIKWKQGFKRDKPPARLPSLPPVCLSVIFTHQWKTLLALSPEELTLPRLLIKSQTLIIEQKHNLPSPPWVPQSNPWKHTHTHAYTDTALPVLRCYGSSLKSQGVWREACTWCALSAVDRKQRHLTLSTQVTVAWKDQPLTEAPRDGFWDTTQYDCTAQFAIREYSAITALFQRYFVKLWSLSVQMSNNDCWYFFRSTNSRSVSHTWMVLDIVAPLPQTRKPLHSGQQMKENEMMR